MSRERLLLASDTRVTCPNCDHEFSLEQGFAKQALESIEASSAKDFARDAPSRGRPGVG